MNYHDDDENALITKFRQNGDQLMVFFRVIQGRREPVQRSDNPVRTNPEMKALSRLLRSGHVEQAASGDFGWVMYRLRPEKSPDA